MSRILTTTGFVIVSLVLLDSVLDACEKKCKDLTCNETFTEKDGQVWHRYDDGNGKALKRAHEDVYVTSGGVTRTLVNPYEFVKKLSECASGTRLCNVGNCPNELKDDCHNCNMNIYTSHPKYYCKIQAKGSSVPP